MAGHSPSDTVFPEIAVQMIEDIPFSEAPERGEKGAFIAIPCQAVQDDIRAQMRDAVPDKGEVFLLFQGGVFACAIEVCKVAVGEEHAEAAASRPEWAGG